MRVVSKEDLSKAIRMASASILMESDCCLSDIKQENSQSCCAEKPFVLQKGANKNGNKDKQRN